MFKGKAEVDELFSTPVQPATPPPEYRGSGFLGFAITAVTFVCYVVCLWAAAQVYNHNLIPDYVFPILKKELGVATKDIPFFAVMVAGFLAYPVSSVIMTFFKAVSAEGLNPENPRTVAYTGIAARSAAAHQNSVEGFGLLVAAVLLSQQAGVPILVRAQFTTYATIARVLFYFFYLANIHFLRSLAWISFVIPCLLLLVASAIPGFSRTYLVQGAFV
ncbi:hypothetical protein HDU97_002321 [Phlyctochytrium planicorne]|nr:hypothetical protein HDU97_002321 [Phlyctochytrium planicorne]